jgi:CRP-like cAMP-binding protein
MPWRRNSLLAAVAPEDWAKVADRGGFQTIRTGDCLQRPGEVVDQVYFPLTGVLTVGAETVDGEIVHVALLGKEGGLGVLEACGSRHAHAQGQVLVSGQAVRLPAAAYRALYAASARFRAVIHEYTETVLAEARLSIACNALHTVEMRLAKTLLLLADLTGSRVAPVTQELLSQMLGVQRTTVSAVMSSLHKRGLIVGRRGAVNILDLEALRGAACSCRASLALTTREIQEAKSPAWGA